MLDCVILNAFKNYTFLYASILLATPAVKMGCTPAASLFLSHFCLL